MVGRPSKKATSGGRVTKSSAKSAKGNIETKRGRKAGKRARTERKKTSVSRKNTGGDGTWKGRRGLRGIKKRPQGSGQKRSTIKIRKGM